MAKKSLFDTLFEEVMSDEEALGISVSTEDDIDTDTTDLEDEITFTLNRDTAQQLIDVLQAALGDSDSDLDDEFSDVDLDDEFNDEELDDADPFAEGLEIEELKDGVPDVTSKGKQKVSTSWSNIKKKAVSTTKKGEDGSLQIQSDRKGTMTSKGNKKVNSTASSLAGSKKSAFEE